MKLRIKVGDVVMVRSGKDKGKTGKVLQAFPQIEKVVVEGVHIMKRHLRSRSNSNPKGQIVELSAPIHVSKVGLWSEELKKAVRFSKRALVAGDKPAKKAKAEKTTK